MADRETRGNKLFINKIQVYQIMKNPEPGLHSTVRKSLLINLRM